MESINALLNKGRIQEAKSACDAHAQEDPQGHAFWHTYAIIETQLGLFQDALTHVQRAQKELPKQPNLHNSEGNIWLRLGKTEEAIQSYESALSIDSTYAPAHNNLGNCFLKQENIDEAEKAYLQAIRHKPSFADAHFNYGRLLLAKGNLTSAIHVLQHAHQLNPDHPAILGQLGELQLLEENHSEAISFFLKRLQKQPKHATTYHRLALARLKQGEFEAAIEGLHKAMELGAEDIDCHYHLATCYMELGLLKEALSHYFQQLEVDPDADTYYNIGVILMAQEHHHDSMTYFAEAARLDPANIDTLLNMGAIALKMGKPRLAVDYYEQCVALDPNNQEYQHILCALKQTPGQATKPAIYVKNLFDHYAPFYDQHLTTHLKYSVPDTIACYLEDFFDESDKKNLKIIDLGCGTGLLGETVRDWKKQMIGIDLSPEMIQVAEQKNCYEELVVGDIAERILPYKHADLVLAADVFTYVGDLSLITQRVKNTLNDGGYFIFTVEKGLIEPFQLQQTIRYTHHRKYLDKLSTDHDFPIITIDNIALRRQKGKPVDGYVVVMQKKH